MKPIYQINDAFHIIIYNQLIKNACIKFNRGLFLKLSDTTQYCWILARKLNSEEETSP